MQIFIRDLMNRCVTIEVDSTDTISMVIQKYLDKQNYSDNVCEYILIHAGKKINYNYTLSDYGIPKGATFHMVLNIRGD